MAVPAESERSPSSSRSIAGAFVAATVPGDAAASAYVKELGADVVIDFQKEAYVTILSGYDSVFGTVAGETYKTSFAVLHKGGTIDSMLERPNTELASQHRVTALHQQTQLTTARLNAVSSPEACRAGYCRMAETSPMGAALTQKTLRKARGVSIRGTYRGFPDLAGLQYAVASG